MGDLKTFWTNPVYPNTSDLSGELPTSRGSDPNADGNPGDAAISSYWPKRAMPESENPSMAESPNSVSGLPPLPNRFQPTEEPPEIPSLKDRIPGTIDKK